MAAFAGKLLLFLAIYLAEKVQGKGKNSAGPPN